MLFVTFFFKQNWFWLLTKFLGNYKGIKNFFFMTKWVNFWFSYRYKFYTYLNFTTFFKTLNIISQFWKLFNMHKYAKWLLLSDYLTFLPNTFSLTQKHFGGFSNFLINATFLNEKFENIAFYKSDVILNTAESIWFYKNFNFLKMHKKQILISIFSELNFFKTWASITFKLPFLIAEYQSFFYFKFFYYLNFLLQKKKFIFNYFFNFINFFFMNQYQLLQDIKTQKFNYFKNLNYNYILPSALSPYLSLAINPVTKLHILKYSQKQLKFNLLLFFKKLNAKTLQK